MLEALLGLLHDVPAGKLAIAELHDANEHDVAELERAGVDAVLVAAETSRRSCRPSRRTSDHLAVALRDDAAGGDPGHRHRLPLAHGLLERDVDDVVAADGGHASPVARDRELDRLQAEPVARKRSRAVGVPPRCVWPSTVTRVSYPVAFVISSATTCPMPPRRA